MATTSPRRPAETGIQSGTSPVPERRTYVLDTSVLLADPGAMTRFAEHEVVLPIVVISELEAKRHHPELGYFARQALRTLDDLRMEHGRLDEALPL
ncbi:PIN domain-containing protein, partial [Actinomadura adrarensis]